MIKITRNDYVISYSNRYESMLCEEYLAIGQFSIWQRDIMPPCIVNIRPNGFYGSIIM